MLMLLSGERNHNNVHLMQVIETEKLNNPHSNETIDFNALPSDVQRSYKVEENNNYNPKIKYWM